MLAQFLKISKGPKKNIQQHTQNYLYRGYHHPGCRRTQTTHIYILLSLWVPSILKIQVSMIFFCFLTGLRAGKKFPHDHVIECECADAYRSSEDELTCRNGLWDNKLTWTKVDNKQPWTCEGFFSFCALFLENCLSKKKINKKTQTKNCRR